jgi:hypothetical protein
VVGGGAAQRREGRGPSFCALQRRWQGTAHHCRHRCGQGVTRFMPAIGTMDSSSSGRVPSLRWTGARHSPVRPTRPYLALLVATDFFNRRGSHAARAGDLLRSVFHSPREPPCARRGITPHPDEAWMARTDASNAAIDLVRAAKTPSKHEHRLIDHSAAIVTVTSLTRCAGIGDCGRAARPSSILSSSCVLVDNK